MVLSDSVGRARRLNYTIVDSIPTGTTYTKMYARMTVSRFGQKHLLNGMYCYIILYYYSITVCTMSKKNMALRPDQKILLWVSILFIGTSENIIAFVIPQKIPS
jgi:hypothetical protein